MGLQQREHRAPVGAGKTGPQVVGDAHGPVAGVADALDQHGRLVVGDGRARAHGPPQRAVLTARARHPALNRGQAHPVAGGQLAATGRAFAGGQLHGFPLTNGQSSILVSSHESKVSVYQFNLSIQLTKQYSIVDYF